jgi:hypothetical protein
LLPTQPSNTSQAAPVRATLSIGFTAERGGASLRVDSPEGCDGGAERSQLLMESSASKSEGQMHEAFEVS